MGKIDGTKRNTVKYENLLFCFSTYNISLKYTVIAWWLVWGTFSSQRISYTREEVVEERKRCSVGLKETRVWKMERKTLYKKTNLGCGFASLLFTQSIYFSFPRALFIILFWFLPSSRIVGFYCELFCISFGWGGGRRSSTIIPNIDIPIPPFGRNIFYADLMTRCKIFAFVENGICYI